jgi:hypothetical protein
MNRAALKVGAVANYTPVTNDGVSAFSAVQNRTVLNRSLSPNADHSMITTQHRTGPDTGLRAHGDGAN